jgi:hypothetical protein
MKPVMGPFPGREKTLWKEKTLYLILFLKRASVSFTCLLSEGCARKRIAIIKDL